VPKRAVFIAAGSCIVPIMIVNLAVVRYGTGAIAFVVQKKIARRLSRLQVFLLTYVWAFSLLLAWWFGILTHIGISLIFH
jgi:hypothetical protein